MYFIKTNWTDTWNVQIDEVYFGGDKPEYLFGVYLDFNPSLPYIYLPDIHYNTTVKRIE